MSGQPLTAGAPTTPKQWWTKRFRATVLSIALAALAPNIPAQNLVVDNPEFLRYFSVATDVGPTFSIADYSAATQWGFLLHEVEVGDFDGSGRQSIVLPYTENRSTASGGLQRPTPIKLLRNVGDGTFTDGAALIGGGVPTLTFPRRVRIGHFDSTGRLGIFIGATGLDVFDSTIVNPGEVNALLLPTPGGLANRTGNLPQGAGFTHALAVGDVNGDGRSDIYVGNLNGYDKTPENPYLLISDGNGGFTRRGDLLPPEVAISGPSRVVFHAASFVDSLGRGVLDLALGGSTAHLGGAANNRVYRSDGNGDLSKSAPILLPKGCFDPPTGPGYTQTLDILPFDLAGHGRPMDLILAQTRADATSTGACIQILINDGHGNYSDQSNARGGGVIDYNGGAIWSLRAIDFNGDGLLDLLLNPLSICDGCAGSSKNRMALLRNDGSGKFVPTPANFFPTFQFADGFTSNYLQLIPIDLRGDGRVSFVQPWVSWANGVPNLKFAVYEQITPYLPRASISLNQHGLTGSWYDPASSGQGLEVEVYPDQSPGTGFAQVSWFTYDNVDGGPQHQRWYTISGPVVSGHPNASLTIYQNTGGNFNAPPITTGQPIGTATLSFDTCTSGQLSYEFTDGTGRTGNIHLTRLTQNVTCSSIGARPTNADFALSGNWYDAAASGQGISVEVNPNSSTVFAAWYTYAPNQASVGAAGQRWYTAQPTTALLPSPRSIPVQISETTGGMFDTPTPPGQKTVHVGNGTLAFQSCSAATFSYTFTGGSSSGLSGTTTLSRVGPVPPGCTL